MARPRVYADETIIKALVKSRGLVFLAAQRLGCHAETIYDRAKVSPAVAACLKEQRGRVVDAAEDKLFAAIRKGKPWAVTATLRTLGKDRGYVERIETRTVTDADIDREIERELAGMAGAGPAAVPEPAPGGPRPADADEPAG